MCVCVLVVLLSDLSPKRSEADPVAALYVLTFTFDKAVHNLMQPVKRKEKQNSLSLLFCRNPWKLTSTI